MSRRNTISREFFSTIAVVLVLGLSVMCAIQTALSAAYFVQERRTALNDILNGASQLCERFAEDGSVLTRPLDDEKAREYARSGFDLFTTSSGAVLFIADENGCITTRSNNSGGIQGGISNGEDIYFRVAFKPIATMARDIETIDDQGHPVVMHPGGRHDVCVVPRAVPIVETMAALVVLDCYLLNKTVHL